MQNETDGISAVQNMKSQELYYRGVAELQEGRIEEAVRSFLECSFFAPDNANPEAAIAECYVYLCDIHSAIRHYRRALWMLTRRRREAVRAAERKRGSSLLLFNTTAPMPHFLSDDSFDDKPAADAGEEQEKNEEEATDDVTISIPTGRTTEEDKNDKKLEEEFKNDGGVQKEAVVSRLGGLLDALSITLFRLADYEQALRCTLEIKDLYHEAGKPFPPQVEVHRATYLVALQREEEAEFLLEALLPSPLYLNYQNEIGSMLIQLYSNRQAFLKAKQLLTQLEKPEDHDYTRKIRFEPNVTIAKHIFLKKYNYYREKALEQRDLGTISKCIMVTPNDLELLFTRAKIYIDRGDEKKSVKDLFQCIKDSNGSHKEAIELMTSVLFSLGSSIDGASGLEDAVTYYSESLKWRTDNIPVILARGDCYVKMEDFEKALADFQRVLEIEPGHEKATKRLSFLHDMWGSKLMALGQLKEAENEFTNAIKANENEALFFYHRAQCRFALDETRYALRDVLSCQQLKPADPRIRAFIIRYIGSEEIPKNANSNMAAEPLSSASTARKAAQLYGQPSARVKKDIQQRQGPSSAPPSFRHEKTYGTPNKKAKVTTLTPISNKTSYKEYVLSQKSDTEDLGLALVAGSRATVHGANSNEHKQTKNQSFKMK